MQEWDPLRIRPFDVEASGTLPEYALQPWRIPRRQMWLTSASGMRVNPATGQLESTLRQLFPLAIHIRPFIEQAIRDDAYILGWNIAYDIATLIGIGLEDIVMEAKWLDGMLLWRHLEIEPEYEFQGARHLKRKWRLKPEAVETFLPEWKGLDEDVDFHSTEPESLAKLQDYNDRDCVRTYVAAQKIWNRLAPKQRQCALVEAECLPMVAQANFNGLQIDELTVHHLGAWLEDEADRHLTELAPHGITEKIVRSPMQLGNLLFGDPDDPSKPHWGLPVLKENKSKKTGNTTRSTDKEVLHELAFQDERAAKVKAYRESLNAKGKFSDTVIKSLAYNGDGRVHPTSNVFATYTGRMTVSSKQGKGKDERPIGFALHQMKREAEFREIVHAPEGYTLVEFDAAGQEFRWMAVASGDETMLQLCEPGEDAHSYMGARIVHVDYHELRELYEAGDKPAERNRYLGKFANLSLQYRTSPRKLRSKARVDYEIPLELPEAQRIWKTYQEAYPGVPVYWNSQIAKVRSAGYVETFAGRRVQVKGNWDGQYGWSMGSTAINTRIQGTGADQKYLAMACIKDYLHAVGGYFSFDLHDGLYLWLPNDKLERAIIDLKYRLDNLPYKQEWDFTPPIPMPWDCKVGVGGLPWGRMKSWKFD